MYIPYQKYKYLKSKQCTFIREIKSCNQYFFVLESGCRLIIDFGKEYLITNTFYEGNTNK